MPHVLDPLHRVLVQIHILLARFTDQALQILPFDCDPDRFCKTFWNMMETFSALAVVRRLSDLPANAYLINTGESTAEEMGWNGGWSKKTNAGNGIWQYGCAVFEECPSIWSHGRAQAGRMGFALQNRSGELTAKWISYFRFGRGLQKRSQRKQEQHILHEIRMHWVSADSWAGFLGKLNWDCILLLRKLRPARYNFTISQYSDANIAARKSHAISTDGFYDPFVWTYLWEDTASNAHANITSMNTWPTIVPHEHFNVKFNRCDATFYFWYSAIKCRIVVKIHIFSQRLADIACMHEFYP